MSENPYDIDAMRGYGPSLRNIADYQDRFVDAGYIGQAGDALDDAVKYMMRVTRTLDPVELARNGGHTGYRTELTDTLEPEYREQPREPIVHVPEDVFMRMH